MEGIVKKIVIYFFLIIHILFIGNIQAQSSKKVVSCLPEISSKQKIVDKYLCFYQSKSMDDFSNVLSLYNCERIDSSLKTVDCLTQLATYTKSELYKSTIDTTIFCPNRDEIYLLLGKIYYCLQNYEQSLLYFDTINTYYSESKSFIEANIWMSRIYMCLNEFENAEIQLLSIKSKINFKDTLSTVNFNWLTTSGDNYIRQEKYSLAIPLLENAVKSYKIDKIFKTRIMYVLAQLYQMEGNDTMAIVYFTKVTKQKVPKLMQAYAYVNSDMCSKRYAQKVADSLHWEELKNSNPEEIVFEPTIVESVHDSDFINSIYPYYFNDPATMFFLEDDDPLYADTIEDGWYDDYDTTMISDELLSVMLENWDSVSVHIPKTDFKNLDDTIYLPLYDLIEGYQLPYFGSVISKFGWRRYRYHYGIDTRNQYGEPIYCVFDGVVRIAKRNRTYGNVIVVRHENGLETFYAHCSKILVKQNQEVKAGDIIALVGSTGRSTGPHLHFEVRYKGNPFNPEILIDFENKKLRSDTMAITKETFNYRTPYGQVASDKKERTTTALYHKVKSGETISGIAKKYHTSVSAIKRLNGLKSDIIREGRNIRVR